MHLPVEDQAALDNLGKWLNDSPGNNNVLVKELSRIGGGTVKETSRRIMYRLLSNKIGMAYSWEGAKKKKAFKNLDVATAILRAVRMNKSTTHATDHEIIERIKLWLVRAKDNTENRKSLAPIQEDEHL